MIIPLPPHGRSLNTTLSTRTILLAAGASAPAGVPIATEMVPKLCALIKARNPPGWRRFGGVIDAVIGGVQSYRSSVRRDPFGPIDVEDLYEMLCALRDRHTLPLAPFVGSWIPTIAAASPASIDALTEDVAGSLRKDLRDLASTLDSAHRYQIPGGSVRIDLRHFSESLRGAIGAAAGHDTHIFDQAAKAVLKGLVNLCTIRDPHTVEYLAPVVRAAQARPIWIATPNYDRGVELAAEAAGIELDLGLREDGIFGEFKEKAPICLAKLHGSVDWSMNRDWSVRVGGYGGDSTALIFGSGNKLRVEGPYLDLLLAFRRQLNRTNALEVCGYSFRDAHVNHLLLRWLTQDAARRIHVFDPCLTMDQIEDNVGRTLGRERKLKKSWLPSVLVLENIGVKEWAAKDG